MTAPTVRRCIDDVLVEAELAERRGDGIHAVV